MERLLAPRKVAGLVADRQRTPSLTNQRYDRFCIRVLSVSSVA